MLALRSSEGGFDAGNHVARAAETPSFDQLGSLESQLRLAGVDRLHQRVNVRRVLRSVAVVARKHLEGEKMAAPRHRHHERVEELHRLGGTHHLILDARRGEEQVDDYTLLSLSLWDEAGGRHAARGLLFRDREDAVAALHQDAHERLCHLVVRHPDGDIEGSCETRRGTRRDSKAADQGPAAVQIGEICLDPPEGSLEPAQDEILGQLTTRP